MTDGAAPAREVGIAAVLSGGETADLLDLERRARRDLTPWPHAAALSQDDFRALGYREELAGIARRCRLSFAGWRPHLEACRRLILDAAALCRRRETAVVLGAAALNDVPLRELLAVFARVVLIDVDAAGLEAARRSLGDRRLRARVTLAPMDLTGIAGAFRRAVDDAIAAGDDDATARSLAAIHASYRLDRPAWRLPDSQRVDLVVSGMVLSQLTSRLALYARRRYAERRGAPPDVLPWAAAHDRFCALVQDDHIRACAAAGDVVALTSDVAEERVALLGGGTITISAARPSIGAAHLSSKLPSDMRIAVARAWTWDATLPGPDRLGTRLRVEGVIATPARAPAATR